MKLFKFLILYCLFYDNVLYSLDLKEMLIIAKKLQVDVLDLKKIVPCWKDIKKISTLEQVYIKNIEKIKHYNKDRCIKSIYDILPYYSSIEYIKCNEKNAFNFEKFPIQAFSKMQPSQGFLSETFILKIPNGEVCSADGYILIDDAYFIRECLPDVPVEHLNKNILKIKLKTSSKIKGSVAVITGCWNSIYFHWIVEVLARLLMLQEKGIDYDWLYVPYCKPYMKETLLLLGVDHKKIIEPSGDFYSLQADQLIVPSYPSNRFFDSDRLAVFVSDWVIQKLRNTFLPMSISVNKHFSKKVFISRNDNTLGRRVLNEDEVFEIFRPLGFERYCLSQLSFLDQVALFSGAEIIAGPHGAGFTNILFCNPGTRIIEIFQARLDCTYFYMAQQLGLKYNYIETINVKPNTYGYGDTTISIKLINDFIFKKDKEVR